MKNSKSIITIIFGLILFASCSHGAKPEKVSYNRIDTLNDSINEDHWPFSHTLSKGDPYISELLNQ